MSETNAQQEYADALAAYREAQARLQEAKRHIPEFPQDRHRRLKREARDAERAHWAAVEAEKAAKRAAAIARGEDIPMELLTFNEIIAKSLAILHQKVNSAAAASEQWQQSGNEAESVRIRLPVQYRIIAGNNDE